MLARLMRPLVRRIRWHAIDIVARLHIGDEDLLRKGFRPAYAPAQPRQLSVPVGDESFDTHDALHGSFSSPEQCSGLTDSLWVRCGAGGECIRCYPGGLHATHNPVALVFFSGDIVLRNARGVRFVTKSYVTQSPGALNSMMADWAADAGAATFFIGRPGIYGSSGDHEKRRLPYEVELMDGALDLLRQRHGIDRFILVGQSGGAHIAAALLSRRKDIMAAVLTSGLLSVRQTVGRWRRLSPVPGGPVYPVADLYDPMDHVADISQDPVPIILMISDPRDVAVPLHSQLQYLRKLEAGGLNPYHIYAHGEGKKRHGLGAHGRKAAALLAQGSSIRDIRRALVDMDLGNLGQKVALPPPDPAADAED